ncbi:MAG: PfkB family carbohydrate kinase [Propionicimonas sp.]
MTTQPAALFVGLATLDVVALVERMPGANEKTTASRTWLAAGGPAAVAAITFAALGGRASLLTALGTGVAADSVRADLASAGVQVVDAAPASFELAVSCAWVNPATGDRAVASGSGTRPVFGAVAAPELTGVDVVLVDGHHPELALAAVGGAAKAGIDVVVDAGSHKPIFDEVYRFASTVICSADYRHPGGLAPPELLRLGPALVAVSQGGDPLRWWTTGASGSLPVPPTAVVDTLGAGDVLHGAYCFALATGRRDLDALAFAVRAASVRVGSLGPFAWRTAIAASAE